MLNKKLQANHWNEMCYQLLKLMTKQEKMHPPGDGEDFLMKLEDSDDEHQSRSVPHGALNVSYENSLQSQIPEGSNSGDDGNTRDGDKIIGGAIGAHGSGIGDSLLVALYAGMTFIYGSSWKGEMASEAKRSIDKSSEGSEEVFLDEAGE
ncbi:hypothetical protein Tco_0665971 [Tanacetum coccineum]